MNIRNITEHHEYPAWLIRNPKLICIHYFILKVLFLRSRVCYRRLRTLLRKQATPNGRILDAGCGEGQYLIPLSRNFSLLNFTGIDHNLNHIDFLNRLTSFLPRPNVALRHETVSSHLNQSVSYDLIYIIGVLQYTQQPKKIIHSCAQVLRTSGQLMVYTPIKTIMHYSFYTRIKEKYGDYDDAQKEYNQIYEEHLLRWIRTAGLHIIRKEYHYSRTATLGHEMMQSLIILFTHWSGVLKIIPCLVFILLIPLFVSLQIADNLSLTGTRKRGNGLLLILQK